jgi:hypothetical protein
MRWAEMARWAQEFPAMAPGGMRAKKNGRADAERWEKALGSAKGNGTPRGQQSRNAEDYGIT